MNSMNGLSMIIPCFNEARSIEQTVKDVDASLNKCGIEYEIIVVDDGSTDGSAAMIKGTPVKNLVLITNEQNTGYGASLKEGIRKSRFDMIGTCDADGTYPAEIIPALLKEMEEHDMAVGSRTGASVKIPLLRRPAKWLLNRLANYLTEMKIPDINSGLRLFRKRDYLKFARLLPNNFSFSTTITLSMLTNARSVKFVPIDYEKRTGKSKIRPVRDTLGFFILIIRTILYFNPLKVFIPLSVFLSLAALAVFVYSWLALPRILDATVVALFLTSVQVLAIGMLADIIEKRSGK